MGLGFHIGNKEGPNDAFSVIYERYPTAPEVMAGDFQCNQSVYNWLREPDFYEHTINVVDDLHCMGHTRCSCSYHAKYFKEAHPMFAHVNDQGIFLLLFFFVCILFVFFLVDCEIAVT